MELPPRDPRRADRGPRRRADATGARPRQAPRRAGARGHPDLAQPARHLRGRDRITVLRLGRDVGVYERAKTTQQEVVQAITAGIPTKVAGHRRTTAGGRAVSTDVDVAAPGSAPRGRRARAAPGVGNARCRRTSSRGTSASCRSSSGSRSIVIFFSFTATNFFTAINFGNIIMQMAGTTMLAYGVVFVLLLGEIDLSIGFLSGIAARRRRPSSSCPGSGHAASRAARDPARARDRAR